MRSDDILYFSSFFTLKGKNAAEKQEIICLFGISEPMTLTAVIFPKTRKQSLCKQSTIPASDVQMVKLSVGTLFSEA